MDLHINADGIDRIILDLQATPKQIDKAFASTSLKLAKWLQTKSIRGLAKELVLPQSEVRRRLRTFRVKRGLGGKGATVWYGLDPIGLIHLGAKKQGKGVAAMGGRYVEGAFIAKGRNGGLQVFKRRGKERLKIDKQSADIHDAAQTYIEDRLLGSGEFDAQFFKVFDHELQWRQSK